MSGLVSKATTFVKGSANDLLDRLIDMNSPSMLRQAIRDLETGESKMKSDAAVLAGGIRTLRREVGDLEVRITDKTAAIKTVMSGSAANKDTVARAYASSLLTLKDQLENKKKELESQINTSASMDVALAKLDTKHEEMVGALRRLESLDRDAKAKEFAAGAIQNAAKLTSAGADISVDDIASKMQSRNDVASEKFDRAMKDPSFQDDPTRGAEVDALLESLK